MTDLKQFPLRERKKAVTRLAILDAVITRLDEKPLADITIEEICEDADISRGTFFQYFPQKPDVLVFYGLLWNLEAMWTATCSPDVTSGIHAIEQMFTSLGQEVETHPRLWMEIVSVRSLMPEKFAAMGTREADQIPAVERLIRFPGLPGIESIPEGNFRQFFMYNLKAAIDRKELPQTTDIETAFLSLACTFYGIPLMSFDKTPVRCSAAFASQLALLWKGLKSA
jgi:AcrR family transcriptional regulator